MIGISRLPKYLRAGSQVNSLLMLTAITRAVSPAIVNCELSFIDRQPIRLEIAQAQHRSYEKLLEKLGAHVISLPAESELPDSMFVEDPAIVLDELAVIMPLGTESRRREAESLALALKSYRQLAYITLPGTMEGGDILRIGRNLYAGISSRTNSEGISQLRVLLQPFGYQVIAVPVTGCLHLKSAVTYLGRNTLLANRAWFEHSRFERDAVDPARVGVSPAIPYQWIDVAPNEPHAANALAIADQVIFPASFPHTKSRIDAQGFSTIPIDISELQKAESGLTCSSLLFNS
jgi:dimethylargininase